MFDQLAEIFARPKPFEYSSAHDLWADEHISAQMLSYHLDPQTDISSRNHDFIERSVKWIVEHFAVSPNSSIADFGCGPGLYTSRLARHAGRVTGIDFSPRSIQYAKEVAASEDLDVCYVNENYLDFETQERFNLVTMIMCDFCALGPAQRRALLAKFGRILAPGGSVLLDVYSLAALAAREETSTCQANLMNGFWAPGDYFGFLNVFKYPEERVVLDKYTIVEKHRCRTIYNWLQYFDVNALKQEFAESGLTIREVYGGVAGSEYGEDNAEFAVVATKGPA